MWEPSQKHGQRILIHQCVTSALALHVAISARKKINLATHAMKSLSVGDPVIIVGALSIDSWEKDGVRHTIPTIEATSIGHNLSFGDGMFKKDESLKNTPQQTQSAPSVPSQNSSSQAAVSENESSAHDIVDAPVNI